MRNRTDKERASFEYGGTTYTGYIVSSTDMQPHFHWFLLEDPNLIQHFGDSIAFQETEGKFIPVHHVSRHSDFIEKVKHCVEKFFKSDESLAVAIQEEES